MNITSWTDLLLDWTYGGVDYSGSGNEGGIECVEHVSSRFRIIETGVGVSISLVALMLSSKLRNPTPVTRLKSYSEDKISIKPMKLILLVTHTFVFGIEVGFKFSSRCLIFLLNPCHITTIIQVSKAFSPLLYKK
jgi:hypothetical protein